MKVIEKYNCVCFCVCRKEFGLAQREGLAFVLGIWEVISRVLENPRNICFCLPGGLVSYWIVKQCNFDWELAISI